MHADEHHRMGGSGNTCNVGDCAEQPLLKMSCDAETGTCAAAAICEDVDGLEPKAEACCQF